MNVDLEGKVVLVAGGTGGLGRAVSLAFLAEGAKVMVTYRKAEELDALELSAGERAEALEGTRVDVTDEKSVGMLVTDVLLKRHGRLGVVVNTVGAYAGGLKLWET